MENIYSKIMATGKFKILVVIISATVLVAELASASRSLDDTEDSYMGQARRLVNSGLEAHQQTQSYSSLMPNEDPHLMQMLRDSIRMATELITNYRQNGLSSLPNLPNLPGLNTVMHVPDKLLRVELSILQDVIRMAQEMTDSPVTATINAPRDLAILVSRIAEQLEQ